MKVLKEDSYDFKEIKLGEVDAEHILRELGRSNDLVVKTKKIESKHDNVHEKSRDVPFRFRDGRDARSGKISVHPNIEFHAMSCVAHHNIFAKTKVFDPFRL